MHTVLSIMLYLALAATVVTLVIGVTGMLRAQREGDQEKSNKLMRMRVLFQAIALIIVALLLITSRHG